METLEKRKHDIVNHLTWDDRVDANEIFVHVEDGKVILTGEVPDFSAKLAASKDAWMIEGVKSVENKLKVKFPDYDKLPDDAAITSTINYMLLWNDNILSSNIKVETRDRIVTLTGTVDSYWEKYLAENIASSARGISDVVNLLDVELAKSLEDVDIQTDIEDALKRSGLVDEKNIHVSVHNGVATLTGTSPHYPGKNEALDIAMYTSGVRNVMDKISIES